MFYCCRRFKIIPFVVFLGSAGAGYGGETCSRMSDELANMHVQSISLLTDKGRLISIDSFVADSDAERSAGYQHICKETIENSTIIFIFPEPVLSRFHMSNVKAPLDIGFFDGNGKLISVMLMKTYEDGQRKLYAPESPFQYALEARQGFFAEHGLTEGRARLVIYSLRTGSDAGVGK